MREEGVLLRAVEPVHLVEEQDGAPALLPQARPCPLGDLADILHAGGDGRQGLERLLGGAGDEARDRGLARTGRPPQHHRREPVGFDQHPQRATRAQQLLLADDFIERTRPQAGRDGRATLESVQHRGGEEVVGHHAEATAWGNSLSAVNLLTGSGVLFAWRGHGG